MQAAERFAAGDKTADIAADLRVGVRQVEKWRSAWNRGGVEALRSKGPYTSERLSSPQIARLAAEIGRGPAAHGFADQRWTLKRIATLIGRLFPRPLHRAGRVVSAAPARLSCQVPARQALERDDAAIETWRREVWPQVEPPRRPSRRGSSTRTSPGPR
jgi:transposase